MRDNAEYGRRVCPVSMAHCCRRECNYDGCAYIFDRPWPPAPDVHDARPSVHNDGIAPVKGITATDTP